jgi:hypothetical protein
MRRVWWGLGAAAVLVGGLAGAGPGSVSAQAAPTLEVTPLRVDPEQLVTFTVRDCPAGPEVQVGESDFIRVLVAGAGLEADATGGTWTGSVPAGLTDWTVRGTCGDVTFDDVIVDIDNPLMSFIPIGAFLATPDPPSTVYGSDCPDGTVARVRFDDLDFGRPTPVSSTLVTSPIDERGDWQVDVPGYLAYGVGVDPQPSAGTVLRERTVNASCGDVTYEVLRIPVQVVGEEPARPGDGPESSSPPLAPPPAQPVPGRVDFTG